MCGRYVLSDTEAVEKKFKTKVPASYNIAPSQDVLVLKPKPEMIKWSYSPKWKEDMNLINCRHETLLEKPSFRGSMRCVFVASGWIEWQRLENEKKPFFHSIKTELIYFAGIYNLTSGCAVVTCQSTQRIAQVHHRQPLLLEEKQIGEWLSGKHQIERKKDDQVDFYEISKQVNSPKNNNSQLLEQI